MKEPKYASISKDKIISYDSRVVDLWKKYLKKYGVKLPKKNDTQERLWAAILLILYDECPGQWIHKDDVGELARLVNPRLGADHQVRHLKRVGWNLETDPKRKGWHRFYDPHRPSPEFENDRLRHVSITGEDFDELKRAYSNRCATCGAEEGKPDVRYGSLDLVVLQKGHMNPSREGVKGNILPQCQFCNRAYKDDFEFDSKGRVRAVASLRPIRRASEKVKRVVYDFLREHFNE